MSRQTESADEYKDQGNDAFKAGNYAKAVFLYSKAIDIAVPPSDAGYDSDTTADTDEGMLNDLREAFKSFPNLHIYYSNRAMAHIRLENFGSAIADATKSIQLVPSFAKGYYRRGCSKVALTHYKDALKDFERCCQISPNDSDAAMRLKECKKEVQAQAFAKAIATEATAKASETVKLDDMTVPEDYKGPRFDGDRPTVEFLNELCQWFKEQKLIAPKYAYKIALEAIKVFKNEPSLREISVEDKFTICGDVHGQYYDLLNIFELNGAPSESNPYLFNGMRLLPFSLNIILGDFVDRGSFGVETVLTLFAYKLAYPSHMFLARGNHEAKSMNRLYGFEGEISAKYDNKLYNIFCELFCLLPLCHVINKKVFVVHGGLFSKDNVSLADIAAIDRDREPPEEGLMAEMMWADPIAVRGRHPSKRGMGLSFGPDITERFLNHNNLQIVVRSHEVKDDGFEYEHGGKLITVFSAPNYCDQMGNKGAYLKLSFPVIGGDAKIEPVSFGAVSHPDVRPMQYANRALFGPAFA
jgi:serine/threonine-protein phosphatase 5